MLHHLPVSHSIFHLSAPAHVTHAVAATPYPVMGTTTRARKGKAGALPEDSNVGDLLGIGRERERDAPLSGKETVLHSCDWRAGGWGLEPQVRKR